MSKETEYQQVAAVTCMDINNLARIAEQDKWTADELREFIFRLKKQKDLLITDAKLRESRYNAISAVFNTAREK